MAKLKAKAVFLENVRSIVDNQRNHSIVCDLPVPQGGTDTGPTALELCLMSLAECGMTIFADVCKKSNIALKKAEITVEADKVPDSPVVDNISMKVSVESSARKELIEAAWRRTEAFCSVMFLLKEQISVKVELESKIIQGD
ncbi:MAG: OsmC family protein [Candidatus Bathyarchaeota archaeon]|nr:OsmC family protein [Candidatus Bathyarchaeota archaeon]